MAYFDEGTTSHTCSGVQYPIFIPGGRETAGSRNVPSTQKAYCEQQHPLLDNIHTPLDYTSSESSDIETMDASALWDHLDLGSIMEGEKYEGHNSSSYPKCDPSISDQQMKSESANEKLLEEEAKWRASRKEKAPPAKKKTGHRHTGLPIRPLSAYNMFFRECRRVMIEDRGRPLPFADMGKEIGKKWKALDEKKRNMWEKQAEEDSNRYRRELRLYKDLKKKERQARYKLLGSNHCEQKEGVGRSALGKMYSNHISGISHGHESSQSKPTVRELPLSHLPSGFKIPSNLPSTGQTVEMPDSQGRLQNYKIEWKLYSVKPSEAGSLMNHLKAVPAETPHLPTPPYASKIEQNPQIAGDHWNARMQNAYSCQLPDKAAKNGSNLQTTAMPQSITAALKHQANSILGMHSHFVASLRGLE